MAGTADRKGRKLRLLLVDDEIEFLDATIQALERRGFFVYGAKDAVTALRLLDNQPFDVAVLDVKMPGMDGIELFRHVKKFYPAIPVVLLTGYGNIRQAFETSREGVFDYLTKPCEVDELAAVARKACQQARRPDSAPEPDRTEEVRLLLVSDDVKLTQTLGRKLPLRGVRVTPARNVAEGLEKLDLSIFDVAIIHLQTPDSDAAALATRIKGMQPNIEMIAVADEAMETAKYRSGESVGFEMVMGLDEDLLTARVWEAYRKRQIRLKKQKEYTK